MLLTKVFATRSTWQTSVTKMTPKVRKSLSRLREKSAPEAIVCGTPDCADRRRQRPQESSSLGGL
ncbi:MAG: hypothetical protein ACLPYS_18060 [Vulcanimicrobiaceae bacterium]|jgi:hypothetical protein